MFWENDGPCTGAERAWSAGEESVIPYHVFQDAADDIDALLQDSQRVGRSVMFLEEQRYESIREAVACIVDEFGEAWADYAYDELSELVMEVV